MLCMNLEDNCPASPFLSPKDIKATHSYKSNSLQAQIRLLQSGSGVEIKKAAVRNTRNAGSNTW